MEPLDPLDQLLRGPSADPWWERLRAAALERRPWLVAGAVITAVVVVVVVARPVASPATVSYPHAGSTPVGSTAAPAVSTSGAASASASSSVTSSVTTTTGPAGSAAGAGGASLVVHVAGAVQHPGLVVLAGGARVADAIAAAGGLRGDADADRLNLAAPVADGVRVYVPAVGQTDPPAEVPIAGAPATGGAAAAGATTTGPVDLNTATDVQLDALPGVGPSTAAAIIAYRTEHHRFRSVDELQDVRGIGPAKFEALRPMVTAG